MLDLKKKQVELMKVSAGKAEMELKIMEREEDIQRLQDNVDNQQKRMNELTEEIDQLQGV